MVAARMPKPPKLPEGEGALPPQAPVNTHLGASVYWKALAILIAITAVLCGANPSAMLMVLLLALPFIQLGASLISAIYLACSSNPDKSLGLKQVWSITLYTILGGAIGFGAMCIVPVFFK